jgi:ABC-2 type transport system permease protein
MVDRIRVIIEKEWAEVFKNRMVLFTITLLPLIFTALPLIFLSVTHNGSGGSSTDIPPQFMLACGNVSGNDCIQIYMMNEFLLLYMIMPLMIPITIAAYSIVGEKATRSLEPLLATPITTMELLAGKILAAVVPAILVTWGCFGIFLLLMPLFGAGPAVQAYVLGPTWLLAILAIGPLMAVLAVNFAVFVSSKVNDPRVAEQISAVLITPILAVLFAQVAGLILINLQLILVAIVVFVLLDFGSLYLSSTFFQRETILTRWK